ncbi:MAG: ABC transporter ATP-binding protein/permease [Oscillospiraceae bacterium]|jgi:ABC-type bacteriocin/lantibiotic exporter with double-glycine peptidase domain|nr:ABC transporter ATP-binding protein/permease [Oscillospiraceae bacterium]
MFYFGWLLDTVLSVAMPLLFGIMIDEIVYYQNVDTFVRIALFFVTLSVFSCVLYFMIYAQHHYLMNMYTLDIKKDLFDHFQKADAEFLSDASTGDIISILTSYSDECMHFVIRNIIHFLNGLIKIAAISIYLFVIDWKIGLAALLVTPISVIVNSKYGKKIRGYSDKQREYYKGYVSWVFEIFTALRDIRMLGAQRKVQSTFEDNHKRMFDINVKSSISSLTANNIIMFTKLIIQLGMFTLAGFAAMSGNITVGLLIVIVAFYEDLTSNTYHLSRTWLDAQDRISYIQRIHDFMETPTEDVWAGKNTLDVSDGKVTFNNIGFAYKKSSEVLNGFSLDIPSGERFALVGKSGCGKTTIAYMMIGFYRPRHGFIEIDGHKLSDCTLKSIRQNIGLIQQDVLVFDGTIKENILLGNRNASDEQVRNVCVQAGLWDFITTLSNGLDTVIGTKGVGLSGGQKQRVAIARIYLKDPKIIIFDEATSSLDSETEENIHAAWKGVLSGRTAIVIAHRLSSVMLCDRVAIIDGGQVSAIGNPQEMQRNNHAFKTLFAIKEAENHVRQD